MALNGCKAFWNPYVYLAIGLSINAQHFHLALSPKYTNEN